MNSQWFGRLPSDISRDFPLQLSPIQSDRRWRYWCFTDVLNQGPTPHCVAYSGLKWLTASPVINKHFPLSAVDLYNECQQVDEWPGTDYDGTSVKALFKILKREGYVSEYRYTTNVHVVANYVLDQGPLIVGTSWYRNMSTIADDGVMHLGGQLLGGHAYIVIGVNMDKEMFRILNSWGDGWGQNGCAWVTFEDMAVLLAERGEAFTAVEVLGPQPSEAMKRG